MEIWSPNKFIHSEDYDSPEKFAQAIQRAIDNLWVYHGEYQDQFDKVVVRLKKRAYTNDDYRAVLAQFVTKKEGQS